MQFHLPQMAFQKIFRCFMHNSVYICALYVCCAHGGQKRKSDHLELALQTVVGSYVGAGN